MAFLETEYVIFICVTIVYFIICLAHVNFIFKIILRLYEFLSNIKLS